MWISPSTRCPSGADELPTSMRTRGNQTKNDSAESWLDAIPSIPRHKRESIRGRPETGMYVSVLRKHCLFCRKPLTKKNAANEHVMPQWILRELGIADQKNQLGTVAARQGYRRDGLTPGRDSSATFVRTAIPDGFRTSRMPSSPSFCRSPEESGVTMLTDEENLSLALWAAKTAFLSQRTVGVPAVISYPCVLVIPRCLRGLLSLPSRMIGRASRPDQWPSDAGLNHACPLRTRDQRH
jgi:hypothetical protein